MTTSPPRPGWLTLVAVCVIAGVVAVGTTVATHAWLHDADPESASAQPFADVPQDGAGTDRVESEVRQVRRSQRRLDQQARRLDRLETLTAQLSEQLVEVEAWHRDAPPRSALARSEFAIVYRVAELESTELPERRTDDDAVIASRAVVADLLDFGARVRVTRVETDALIGLPRRSWTLLPDWEVRDGRLYVVAERTIRHPRRTTTTERPLHEATSLRVWISVRRAQ